MNLRKIFEDGRYEDVVAEAAGLRGAEERLMLGIALFRLGRAQEAYDVLDGLAREAEDLVRGMLYLARICRQRGDVERARMYAERYLAFYPDDDEALDLLEEEPEAVAFVGAPSVDLARIYVQQGHIEQALEIFAALLENDPGDEALQKEAREVQNRHTVRILEGWLERLKP